MNLQGDALFDYGKSELRPEAESALEKVAVVISQFPESNVLIRGYTDAKGPADANFAAFAKTRRCGEAMAGEERRSYRTKIATEGLGEKDPVAENKNADGSDNPEGSLRRICIGPDRDVLQRSCPSRRFCNRV